MTSACLCGLRTSHSVGKGKITNPPGAIVQLLHLTRCSTIHFKTTRPLVISTDGHIAALGHSDRSKEGRNAELTQTDFYHPENIQNSPLVELYYRNTTFNEFFHL